MRKLVTVGVLALAGALLSPAAAAFAADPGTCKGGELSAVTGPGPAAKKDRNGNLWVCTVTNPRTGKWRFVDDVIA